MFLHITNSDGYRFSIYCLRKGDRFGLDDSLVFQGDAPLVEFYDPDPLERANGPLGRCVASYLAADLLFVGDETGLGLNGRKPWWRLDPESLRRVRQWVRAGCPDRVDLDRGRNCCAGA